MMENLRNLLEHSMSSNPRENRIGITYANPKDATKTIHNTEKVYFLHLRYKFHGNRQMIVKQNEYCFRLHQITLRRKRAGYLGSRRATWRLKLKIIKFITN
jgi:hypothetical protein